jgi:hypothetical protein
MKRLILAGESGVSLFQSGLADVVIPFVFRFVWGPLPSPDEPSDHPGMTRQVNQTRNLDLRQFRDSGFASSTRPGMTDCINHSAACA